MKLITLVLVFGFTFMMVKEVYTSIRARKEVSEEKDFFENIKDKEILVALKEYKENPSYKTAYNLGWLFAKKKMWKNAIEFFEKAIKYNPSSFGSYNNIGNIYFHLGNLERAIEYWKISLKIKPDQIDARFNLGYAYYLRGELKLAAENLKKVLEIDPENAKAKIVLKKLYQ
ncbi:MAG: hypothetical protein DRI36_03130 [Caldiserica bacterium]|nr:MAG: hypothetical protein DRI36_03130 [Caldisericota bacterium]